MIRPGPDDFCKDAALGEIVRRLEKAYQPDRVYLFGSRARGTEGPDSDYDILLVVGDEALPDRKRAKLAYQVLRGTGVAADIVVWTRRAFEEHLHIPASLPATVVREGRALFGV